MADNPLYPGYIPKKEDEQNPSPLYPGYYPGKPIKRKPPDRNFLQPIEYDFDAQMEYIDQNIGEGLPNTYRWVKERIVDDFKSELKATISPSGLSASELDDYDVSDMPGAVGIKLDLSKVTKPKELVSDLIKSSIENTANINLKEPLSSDFGDFRIGVERKLWRQTLGIKEENGEDTPEGERPFIEKAAEEAYKTSTLVQYAGQPYKFDLYPDAREEPPPNPLDLSSTNIREGRSGNYKDVYKETALAFVDFQANKGITSQRDKQYREYQKKAIHAVDTELMQKRRDITHIDPSVRPTLDLFHTQAKIAEEMESTGKGVSDFSKEIDKTLIDNPKAKQKQKYLYLYGRDKCLEDLGENNFINIFGREEYNRFFNPDGTRRERVSGLIESKLENLDNYINAARAARLPSENIETLKNETDDYRQYLLNTQDFINNVDTSKLDSQNYLKQLRIKLNGLKGNGKKFTTNNPFGEGIQDRFLRRTSERHLQGTNYVLKGMKPVRVENSLADILGDSRFDPLDLQARKLRPLSLRAQIERSGYSFEEAFEDITSGKFTEKYIWNKKIKPKIEAYLPSTALKRFLEKRHYFGLVINEDLLTDRQRRRFAHSVFNLKNTFKINAGNRSWKIEGGKHLAIIGDKNVEKGFEMLRNRPALGSTEQFTHALLSGAMRPLSREEAIKLQNFKNWGARTFGANWNNPTFRKDVFLQLRKRQKNKLTIDVNRQFRGHFERYWEYLNSLQEKLLKSKLYTKLINPILKIRTLITERLASALSEVTAKLLAALGAGATGGLSVLLSKIIKQVIRPIINYTVKKIGTFTKGLVQADWQAVFKEIDKEVQNTIKTVMGIAAIPIIALFSFMIFVSFVVGTGQTPVDATSGNVGYVRYLDVDNYDDADDDGPPFTGEVYDTMPPVDPNASDIAKRAWELVNGLQIGIGGMWNYHPDYAAWLSSIGLDRFWCTVLPYLAISETVDPDIPQTWWTETKKRFYETNPGYTFISTLDGSGQAAPFSPSMVQSGDVIFYSELINGVWVTQHVGVVYSASEDGFWTVESNTYFKSTFIPSTCDANGCLIDPQMNPYSSMNWRIEGFGRYIGP